MHEIGKSLKKARIEAGLTQKEVEAQLDLRNLSMKDYETGRLKLPVEIAARLAELYKTDLNKLTSTPHGTDPKQAKELHSVSHFLSKNDSNIIFLDPVIRAHIEENAHDVFEHSMFDLIIKRFSPKQKKLVVLEILKTLGSLMGTDKKITESELVFFNNLISDLGLKDQVKSITRTFVNRHDAEIEHYGQLAALKHFVIWIMFFLAKSDGKITHEEISYIEETAERLKINRSNYLSIKNFFKDWL